MSEITAKLTADSQSEIGRHRLSSPQLVYPRMIHAEFMTHRVVSKNLASSRAIPYLRMAESVESNPFIPIAWQKDHAGMQGIEYLDEQESNYAKASWLRALEYAISSANQLNSNMMYKGKGVTKQLCNRLLEPFQWTVNISSATEWENFFTLRCPQYEGSEIMEKAGVFYRSRKDWARAHNELNVSSFSYLDWAKFNRGKAEIHMMALAEAIYDELKGSTPRALKEGEWHIVYENKIDTKKVEEFAVVLGKVANTYEGASGVKLKIATAMAARTSYTIVGDERELSYNKLIDIYENKLLPRVDEPFHASPFEHCARSMYEREYFEYSRTYATNLITPLMEAEKMNGFTMIVPANPKYNRGMKYKVTEFGWCRNFRGFVQLRHILESQGHI